jgi:hypothetical protein
MLDFLRQRPFDAIEVSIASGLPVNIGVDRFRAVSEQDLARVHDDAAAVQTEAAAYYRGLADRIAVGLLALGQQQST